MTTTLEPPFIARLAQMHEGSAVAFDQVLGWYLEADDAVVFKAPGTFLMARPGWWDGEFLYLGAEHPNTWFVHQAHGNARELVQLLQQHQPLPNIAWHRHRKGRERLNVTRIERFTP